MIHVVFMACSIVQGASCSEKELAFHGAITPFTCFMYGQVELAKWANEHPNYSVHGWKCVPHERLEVKA